MAFGIRIRSETGKIIYDSNEKVTSFLGSCRVQLTIPEGGGVWNADNLKFKLDMVNKGSE